MGFFDELIEKANKRKYKEHYEKAEEVMSGLAILLAISFFFPGLLIPIILIAVALEVVVNVIPGKKE